MHASKPQRALIIEGGAMRGIFAAGVLDAFIEQDYYPFDFVIGVSAGSTTGIAYLTGDHGRSYKILTDHARRPDFMSFTRYARGGHLCDVSWLWQRSRQELSLDVDVYVERNIPLWVVTTSVRTGHPLYHKVDAANVDEVFPASCAMPVVFRDHPPVAGEPMSDGGLGDSIPVRYAYKQGAREITVIRSVPESFRTEQLRFPGMLKPLLSQHPRLLGAALRCERKYHQALAFMQQPPADCQVHQLYPPEQFPVARFTRDISKLQTGYEQGVKAAEAFISQRRSGRLAQDALQPANV
ncbi:patatin-like phospholipase family protein [Aliidiomarina soli]|uniref:Patatin family protein n=1 Tax=Aliidiomarina soli TaxID=1928574 RepID=A0A432WFE9_9GAMM|nr:patatin family protein [Aliidiomarina soli]RUO32526.1 patatin family protein [Aliidiomarina soli]